jgi:uncharacterized protein (TIGR02246 family)
MGVNAANEDAAAIVRLVSDWHDAAARGDVDAILPLMTEDVVFLVAGQPPMRGREAFAEGLRSLLRTHRIASRGEIEEVVVSGELAWCWSKLVVEVFANDAGESAPAEMRRSGNTLSVLRRGATGWQIARDANLLVAESR